MKRPMIIVFYETPTFGLATKHRFFNPVYSDEIMKNLYARQFLKNRGLLTKHEKITLIDEFNPIKMPVFVNLTANHLEVYNFFGYTFTILTPSQNNLQVVGNMIICSKMSDLQRDNAFNLHRDLKKKSRRVQQTIFSLHGKSLQFEFFTHSIFTNSRKN
jgi:hypothetical protein